MKRFKQLFWLVLAITFLAACGGKTTPPGASYTGDSFNVPEGFGGAFEVLQWADGPAVVFVHDIEGEHENSGSSSTTDPVWRGKGFARSTDGRQITWRAETSDGKTVTLWLNEQKYDLSQDSLFLIRTSGEQTQIIQHPLNFEGPCPNADECQSRLMNDPLVQQFIRETLDRR